MFWLDQYKNKHHSYKDDNDLERTAPYYLVKEYAGNDYYKKIQTTPNDLIFPNTFKETFKWFPLTITESVILLNNTIRDYLTRLCAEDKYILAIIDRKIYQKLLSDMPCLEDFIIPITCSNPINVINNSYEEVDLDLECPASYLDHPIKKITGQQLASRINKHLEKDCRGLCLLNYKKRIHNKALLYWLEFKCLLKDEKDHTLYVVDCNKH